MRNLFILFHRDSWETQAGVLFDEGARGRKSWILLYNIISTHRSKIQ